MADTGIFATTAEVVRKAGAGCSATYTAEAAVNDFMTQVESEINCTCRRNFSDTYSSLNVDVKGLLKQCASNLAAIYIIQADMSGINSRVEAENRINVLRDAALRIMNLLKDRKVGSFLEGDT